MFRKPDIILDCKDINSFSKHIHLSLTGVVTVLLQNEDLSNRRSPLTNVKFSLVSWKYATLAGFIPAAEVAASLPGHSSGQIETR